MKRFLKRLIWILPLAWFWAAFYIGDIIFSDLTGSGIVWYALPYIVTAFVIFVLLFLFSDKIFPINP